MKHIVMTLTVAALLVAHVASAQPTPQQLQNVANDLSAAADALKKAAADLTAATTTTTASPCKTTSVPAGADLQAAITAAAPCDTLVLSAGATYTGNFLLPVKTGTPPAPYAPRVTIISAGWALTGRVGPANAPMMAKLQALPGGLPDLRTAPGASHYVIRGLDLLPLANGVNDILDLGDGSSAQTTLAQVPDDLVIDQCYLHGDPTVGQKRGIALNSATTTISNSYISGMRAQGQDSQAIAGWNGPGPYTITNNYLEAASENVLFGGADPAIPGLVPSTITLTGNLITKPLAWRGVSGWNVKNLIELKSAAHVTISGNVVENVWADAQEGYSLVLTVRDQDGHCPQCTLQDITVSGNVFRHMGAFVNILALDDGHGIGAPSTRAAQLRIANNLVYDVDATAWGGSGRVFQIIDGPNGLVLDHNTIAPQPTSGWLNSVFTLQAGTYPIAGLVVTGNIAPEGEYGIKGASDIDLGIGTQTLASYAPVYTWSGNTIIHDARAGTYPYPTGTIIRPPTPATLNADFTPASGVSGGADVAAIRASLQGGVTLP